MPSAPFRLNRSGLMLALVSAAFAGEADAAAGRVEFTIGGVTVSRNGTEHPLTRGVELDNGDTVRTNDGRTQIRFTDGAYVSLQPNTEYSIRDYQYGGSSAGQERGFFGLLKGAMRTVTGAIGRINRDAYRIATPTATVGIRGTGGVIQVQDDGSTLVIGTSGIWSLTNPAGSVDVPAGTSAVAPTDPAQPPQETTQQPSSGPAPVPEHEPVFVAGEEVDEQGLPVIPAPSFTPLVSGSGYATAAAFGEEAGVAGQLFFNTSVASSDNVDAIFNPAGQLTRMTAMDPFFGTLQYTLGTGGSHADFDSDGILAWGRWTGPATVTGTNCDGPCSPSVQNYGANQGFHYVIGMPTTSMPTTGAATYTLIGASKPTYVSDIGVLPGSFSGSLSVDFSRSTVGMNLNVAMPDSTNYVIGGSASISGVGFSGSHFFGSGPLTISGGTCGSSSCQALVTGFFAGANAARAGLGYHIQDSNKDVVGAAAFQQSSIQASPPLLLREPALVQGGL